MDFSGQVIFDPESCDRRMDYNSVNFIINLLGSMQYHHYLLRWGVIYMKKIFNICILLLSLIGCSNSVVSTNSSSCPCENLTIDNTKYTIESILGLSKENVYRAIKFKGISYEIKEKYFEKVYEFLDREYMMTNMKYIDDNFIEYYKEEILWVMFLNEDYSVVIRQVFNETGDSYLIILDADPYISNLITKEENESFLSSVYMK